MGTFLAEHTDVWCTVTNCLVAHVTWRTLPDESRHHVKQAYVKVRKVTVVTVRRRKSN